MKQCKFQNIKQLWYRYIEEVFWLCNYSQVFLWTLDFPLGTNFYQKVEFLAILGAVSPHF